MKPAKTGERIRIGISGCLLGERVRYDGGDKRNDCILATLGPCFEFVPLCPEVGIGLGVPRDPIRLVRVRATVRARGVRDPAIDVSDGLKDYARRAARKLAGVSGYILKTGSPSCGMDGVKVHDRTGAVVGSGAGLYAATLMSLLPALPFEEEGRLLDPVLRENFIERVLVYDRWRKAGRRLTPKALVAFHARHKFIALSHNEKIYRALGRLVARAGEGDVNDLGRRYIGMLMSALRQPATRAAHANVLQHVTGFFKDRLDSGDRREMDSLIEAFRLGRIPLIVPVTLIRHYLRQFPQPYLQEQYYLEMHGGEMPCPV